MDYNTEREQLIIPEYGRHVQKMVAHATSIADRKEREKCVNAIITYMGQMNPHLRDIPDYKHKLWDHLFIMSDFKLDVDSPYEKPSPEKLSEKPDVLKYPKSEFSFSYYGKHIETMIPFILLLLHYVISQSTHQYCLHLLILQLLLVLVFHKIVQQLRSLFLKAQQPLMVFFLPS